MLTDCLGREIKVDDLICATVRRATCFGRVVRMTRTTIQLMIMYDTSTIWVDKKNSRGHYGGHRAALKGDILRCVDAERCMIVNGVDDVEHLFVDEATVRQAGFQRFDEGT